MTPNKDRLDKQQKEENKIKFIKQTVSDDMILENKGNKSKPEQRSENRKKNCRH